MKHYYKLLKEAREDKDILQKQAAHALSTTQQQIFKYESGLQEMTVSRLKILCELYDVSADYILGLNYGMPWPRKERTKLMKTDDIIKECFDKAIDVCVWAIDEQNHKGNDLLDILTNNLETAKEIMINKQ